MALAFFLTMLTGLLMIPAVILWERAGWPGWRAQRVRTRGYRRGGVERLLRRVTVVRP